MDRPVFMVCELCGNLVGFIKNGGGEMVCCGLPMQALVPNTIDASKEKHVPVIEKDGRNIKVKIGAAPHPMQAEHSIEWVYLLTDKGGQRKALSPGGAPEAGFMLTDDDKAIEAYAYCNLHGLWAAEA